MEVLQRAAQRGERGHEPLDVESLAYCGGVREVGEGGGDCEDGGQLRRPQVAVSEAQFGDAGAARDGFQHV